MQEAQLVVTAGTYTHVVKACTNAGEVEEARSLLDEMRANGMRVKQGTAAMVDKMAERRSAQRSRNGPLPRAATRAPPSSAAAQPSHGATTPPQAAAASWTDVLPTTPDDPSAEAPPAIDHYQPLRPAVEEPSATSADMPDPSAAEPTTDSDGAAGNADATAVASPSVAIVPPLPPTGATAAARLSERAAEMLAARPPRSRSVKDFIRGVGGHSRNGRWAEIVSDLDKAVADPNIKVRSCKRKRKEGGLVYLIRKIFECQRCRWGGFLFFSGRFGVFGNFRGGSANFGE